MAHPVVYFEIMSPQAPKLREFYAKAFDWEFAAAKAAESDGAGDYATVEPVPGSITGGIGQTANGYSGHVTFESLGGKRILNPSKVPDMQIEIALFSDPEGNTVGLVNTGKM